jgi:hypothetical protein
MDRTPIAAGSTESQRVQASRDDISLPSLSPEDVHPSALLRSGGSRVSQHGTVYSFSLFPVPVASRCVRACRWKLREGTEKYEPRDRSFKGQL